MRRRMTISYFHTKAIRLGEDEVEDYEHYEDGYGECGGFLVPS